MRSLSFLSIEPLFSHVTAISIYRHNLMLYEISLHYIVLSKITRCDWLSQFSVVSHCYGYQMFQIWNGVVQRSRCNPVGDNITWPRITLHKTHWFLLRYCPGIMPWAFKVTEINTLFVTLQIIHVFLLWSCLRHLSCAWAWS